MCLPINQTKPSPTHPIIIDHNKNVVVFENNSAKYGIDLLLTPPGFIIRGCKAEQQAGGPYVRLFRGNVTVHPL